MATAKEKLIASAQKLVEKGAFEKAIKEYLRVVQEDAADVRIWLKIGDLYAKIGKKTEATDTYQRVAQFYSDQGFYLKSVAVYKQILKLDPRLVDVNQRLAELYRQLGLLSDAISQYEQVAQFFHKEGKVKEAVAAMKQIVDLDPDTVASRIKLAEMYSREQMPGEAIIEFTRAADQLKEAGRLDEYMKVAERLLFHAADNKPVTKELARLYIEKNDPRRALPKLQVLFKADPRDLDVLRLLARAFEGLEQRPKAVSVYKELARILNETGDQRAATEIFRQILAIQPDDVEAVAAVKGQPAGAGRPPSPASAPLISSSGPVRAHATGAERALDSGGHRSYPAVRVGASGSRDVVPEPDAPTDALAEEVAKLLSETDVYIKYNLHAKAIDHLQRVFERAPRHIAAREKLKALYLTTGRKDDAITELWALADSVPTDRARRYVREIYELDPSNARAAQTLNEPIRAPGQSLSTIAPEPEDDFGVAIDSDFGLPSSKRVDVAKPRAIDIEPEGLDDEVIDEIDAVDIDDSMLAEDDSVAVADDELVEQPASEMTQSFDDDLIPVVIDTGGDATTNLPAPLDEDSDRFTLDGGDDPVDMPPASSTDPGDYGKSSPDAETRFRGAPRGVAAPAPAGPDDSELSFADIDVPEERTGLMDAEELAALRSAPQFVPGATTVSAPSGDLEPLEPENNEDDGISLPSAPLELLPVAAEPPEPVSSSGRRSAPVPIPDPVRPESNLEDDLDESDFFVQQSLFDEARSMLHSLLERYPNHPLVLAKLRDLDGMDPGTPPTNPEDNGHSFVPTAELELPVAAADHSGTHAAISEHSAEFNIPADPSSEHRRGGVEVTRRGVIERGVSAEDFETHYDLGIAYKEMGLIDDAIAEFRIVMKDPVREVQCHLMIGLCHLEKQMFTEAINQFKKGLYVEGITDAEALSLYYELGQAYEKIGDPREALYYYDKVHKRDESFRDLPRRLRALRGEEPEPEAPVRGNEDVDAAFDSLLDEG